MKRKCLFLTLLIGLSTFVSGFTNEPLNLLTNNYTQENLKIALVKDKAWVPYPAYTDRIAWDKLSAENKTTLIQQGEKFLTYNWQVVKATDYLAYERNGSRVVMEKPMNENAVALSALFFAELAEGRGRFLDQIINGVWYFTEMGSWSLSAHLPAYQPSKRTLPDHQVHVVDLMAGDIGAFLSWIYYFLHNEMNKINPIISFRLKYHIKERIIAPYMSRTDMWWQAFELKENMIVNNWNPWCNFNVLTSLLLIEDDPELQLKGIYKTMQSVDKFINYVKHDGACEEGPSYWGHAAGKLYDYLQILSLATASKVSIFQQPAIKDMGEYFSQSYIGGDSWVVNFADASAKGGGDALLIFRYGDAVGSQEMKKFAKYLFDRQSKKITISRDTFRSLESLKSIQDIQHESAALPTNPYKWYPETEFLYLKSPAYFFAAKGGFNNESHNHNDIGNFILYLQHTPVFIDAGVGTYNKKTFSDERYDIWTMQSEYHSLPIINGFSQRYGREYKSKDVQFNPSSNTFQLDLANAYPIEAKIKSWVRTYTAKNNELIIADKFDITAPTQTNIVNFMLAQKPQLLKDKVLLNNGQHSLSFDNKRFDVSFETILLDDTRLSNIWGPEIYKVTFKAKQIQAKGQYTFYIK